MSKEEFNKIWKDTSKKGILNQYYYDYMYMKKLKEDINKAIEYIENENLRIVDISKEIPELCDGELLEILRGGNNE